MYLLCAFLYKLEGCLDIVEPVKENLNLICTAVTTSCMPQLLRWGEGGGGGVLFISEQCPGLFLLT